MPTYRLLSRQSVLLTFGSLITLVTPSGLLEGEGRDMAWALLIIRVVLGTTLAAHGMQKALGWFGGAGFAKVAHGFDGRGLKPGWLWAGLAVLGEVGGGLSLA